LARTKDGEFYTRRIDLTDEEELSDRMLSAKTGFNRGIRIGGLTTPVLGPAGGIVGGALGAISGFILGDQETVFPIDMIAIPAYQAYLLNGTPAFQIYIKEGEVLTQVMPTDAMMASEVVEAVSSPVKRKRAKGAGLPKKFAKMGFKKGWAAYKKTQAYKNKQKKKAKSTAKRGSKK